MVISKIARDGFEYYEFFCPGCGFDHSYFTAWPTGKGFENKPKWNFNGNLDKPSFTPSLLNTWGESKKRICHLFVTDGKIIYCSDSTHSLAGKTVEMGERHG